MFATFASVYLCCHCCSDECCSQNTLPYCFAPCWGKMDYNMGWLATWIHFSWEKAGPEEGNIGEHSISGRKSGSDRELRLFLRRDRICCQTKDVCKARLLSLQKLPRFKQKHHQGSSSVLCEKPSEEASHFQSIARSSCVTMCKHAWPASPMSCFTNEPKTLTELFQEVIWLLLFDYQNQVIHVDRRCQSCNCQEWPGKHKLKTWRSISSIGVSESRTENENMQTQMLVELQKHSSNSKTNRQNHVNKKNTRFADLAGAEPFPMQGCEKFVLKPLGFDAESIWSSSLWWWFHDDCSDAKSPFDS